MFPHPAHRYASSPKYSQSKQLPFESNSIRINQRAGLTAQVPITGPAHKTQTTQKRHQYTKKETLNR